MNSATDFYFYTKVIIVSAHTVFVPDLREASYTGVFARELVLVHFYVKRRTRVFFDENLLRSRHNSTPRSKFVSAHTVFVPGLRKVP